MAVETEVPMSLVDMDRRAHDRFATHFPLRVDVGVQKRRFGVAYDASAGGLLFNTRTRFEPGTEVELSMSPRTEPPPSAGEASAGLETIHVRARVVRVEPVAAESPLPWRWLTAVQFERELPHLVLTMRDGAARPPPLPDDPSSCSRSIEAEPHRPEGSGA
jgi:hypothetical protein